FLAFRLAVRLAVARLDLALVVGEELCLVAAIPGAGVNLAVAPHAEVKRGALLGDLLRGHASVDEVLDCLVVCVLCHFFFPFSLSVFSICHVRVICKAICHVCDESHIFYGWWSSGGLPPRTNRPSHASSDARPSHLAEPANAQLAPRSGGSNRG